MSVRSLWLVCLSILVFGFIALRASRQSITIDEADTYIVWVARGGFAAWEPASNNHQLNSLVMSLAVFLFGTANLSIRASALLGAALYVVSAASLTSRLSTRTIHGLALFLCLTCNPLILDYLVAARGYSLAMGFLLLTLAIATSRLPAASKCAWGSSAMALMVSANLSFAFVAVTTLVWVFIVAARGQTWRSRGQLAAAAILPGALISLVTVFPMVVRWPKSQLWFGAHSFGEMGVSLVQSSLYRPHEYLSALTSFGPYILWAILAATTVAAMLRPPHQTACVALFFAGVLVTALVMHGAAHYWGGVLLPKERTALWIVLLTTLIAGALTSSRVLPGVPLLLLAVYFLSCLRVSYFKEWYWNSDAATIYSILADYNHRFSIREVGSTWKMNSVLNFYRLTSRGNETFREFGQSPASPYPADRAVYVVDLPFDREFIKADGLQIVYEGPISEIGVAVRPSAIPIQRRFP